MENSRSWFSIITEDILPRWNSFPRTDEVPSSCSGSTSNTREQAPSRVGEPNPSQIIQEKEDYSIPSSLKTPHLFSITEEGAAIMPGEFLAIKLANLRIQERCWCNPLSLYVDSNSGCWVNLETYGIQNYNQIYSIAIIKDENGYIADFTRMPLNLQWIPSDAPMAGLYLEPVVRIIK